MESKEKEIEEMTQDFIKLQITTRQGVEAFAKQFYDMGYRKTFTSELASETQKAYKDGYRKGFEDGEEELKNEIYALKVQIECLEEHCTALEEDNINDEMNLDSLSKELEITSSELSRYTENVKAMCEETKKQAVKEFAEKLKRECHNFYSSIDHYCCSEKAIKLADIDKLLKEFLE